MKSWKLILQAAMLGRGETLSDILANTMTEEEFEREFDPRLKMYPTSGFTVWTEKAVYFPCFDDYGLLARSVSRNPDGAPTLPYSDE